MTLQHLTSDNATEWNRDETREREVAGPQNLRISIVTKTLIKFKNKDICENSTTIWSISSLGMIYTLIIPFSLL